METPLFQIPKTTTTTTASSWARLGGWPVPTTDVERDGVKLVRQTIACSLHLWPQRFSAYRSGQEIVFANGKTASTDDLIEHKNCGFRPGVHWVGGISNPLTVLTSLKKSEVFFCGLVNPVEFSCNLPTNCVRRSRSGVVWG